MNRFALRDNCLSRALCLILRRSATDTRLGSSASHALNQIVQLGVIHFHSCRSILDFSRHHFITVVKLYQVACPQQLLFPTQCIKLTFKAEALVIYAGDYSLQAVNLGVLPSQTSDPHPHAYLQVTLHVISLFATHLTPVRGLNPRLRAVLRLVHRRVPIQVVLRCVAVERTHHLQELRAELFRGLCSIYSLFLGGFAKANLGLSLFCGVAPRSALQRVLFTFEVEGLVKFAAQLLR